jgi:hypothetical protein
MVMNRNKKIQAYVMMGAGFFLIAVNALNYLLRDSSQVVLGILGLMFVVIGLNIAKKSDA